MSIVIGGGRSPAGRDHVLDVIVKLIPAEVLALHTAALTAPAAARAAVQTALLLVGILLTPLVLFLVGRHEQRRPPPGQYVLRILVFVCWALASSAPLAARLDYARWIPGLTLVALPVIGSFLFPPLPDRR